MHSMSYSGLIGWFGIISNGGVPNLNTQVGYFVQVGHCPCGTFALRRGDIRIIVASCISCIVNWYKGLLKIVSFIDFIWFLLYGQIFYYYFMTFTFRSACFNLDKDIDPYIKYGCRCQIKEFWSWCVVCTCAGINQKRVLWVYNCKFN
jgi:hypothetical protein